MRQRQGMSLYDLVVIIILLSFVGAVLVCTISAWLTSGGNELTTRTVCMGNLLSIGKAVVLYKRDNDGKWPWLETGAVGWDRTPTGTSRLIDPNSADRGSRAPRSITSPMFLLVRELLPSKVFLCPSDRQGHRDPDVCDANDNYYWDFSSAENVSYSWQAPVFSGGRYVSGINDNENDAVVAADQTPRRHDPNWQPDDISQPTSMEVVRRNMSQNHSGGKRINCLMVGMNVQVEDRPDCGVNKDNIYTASGTTNRGSQSATSLDLMEHLSARDSFLIGPVPAKP